MKLTIQKPDNDVVWTALHDAAQANLDEKYDEAHKLTETALMTANNHLAIFDALYLFGLQSSNLTTSRYYCGSYTIKGDLAEALRERDNYQYASFGKLLLYMLLTAAMFCLTAMVLFYPPVTNFIDGFITYDNFLIVSTIITFIGFFLAGFGGVLFVVVVLGIFVWLATSLLSEAMILLIGCWAARILIGILLLYIAKSCFFHNIAYHSKCFSRSAKIKEMTNECRTYAQAIYLRVLWAQHEAADQEQFNLWCKARSLLNSQKLSEYIEYALGYYKSVIDECTE